MSETFYLTNDQLTINIPLPGHDFYEMEVEGWSITPEGTKGGGLKVKPWSEEKIKLWRRRKALYDLAQKSPIVYKIISILGHRLNQRPLIPRKEFNNTYISRPPGSHDPAFKVQM